MNKIKKYLQSNLPKKFETVKKMLLNAGFECSYYSTGEAFYDKGCFRFCIYYTYDKNGIADKVTDWFFHDCAA